MIEYHALFLGVLVGSQALFAALAILNLRHGARESRRNEEWLTDRIGIDDVGEMIDYNRAKTGLSQLQSWMTLALLVLALYAGVVTGAVRWLTESGLGPVTQGLAFFLGLIALQRVAEAPFDLYETFVVEEQFGFNEQSPRLWLRDFVIGTVVALALGGLLLGAVLWVLDRAPTWWWVGAWLLVVGFGLVMQKLYPRVIAPLFNEFDPVEDGELREAIEDVFDRAGFETSDIYTMDASRRSSHLNAYFTGFGATKRVVLFDTLVEKLSLPEIQSVLAHELAHWKKAHIWKGLAASAVRFGVVFAALGYLVDAAWLYALFDLPTGATYAGLFVAALLVLPLLELSAPLVNRFWLGFEREADAFAVDVMGDGGPMADALAQLASENLANPFPHPWYAAFHHTHPPIPERIRRVQERADVDADGAPDAAASA